MENQERYLKCIVGMLCFIFIFAAPFVFADQQIKDPYEKFNRGIFAFNDHLDTYILKPIAQFYNKIIPRPLNLGIHNFFNNLNNIPTIINDILQFNFYQAANDAWRLGINTTLGIGGLFDVAKTMGLDPYINDFGLTLARWGYKDSNYFIIPFLGASTIRDALGIPVDYYGFSVYPYIQPQSTRFEVIALGVVDWRAQLVKYQSVLEEVAVDKYAFQRDAYIQRRAYQIKQNEHLGYKGRTHTVRVGEVTQPHDESLPGINIAS